MRPNLFDFAPSELSQDAFLCWLLAYADPQHAHNRPELHALGREFLSLMFAKDSDALAPADIQSVKVDRQVAGIDILCVVNGTIAFLIEDKVGTTEHSGQLDAYSRHVEKLGFSEDGKRTIRVYLQTGNQCSYKRVRESGYHVLSRLEVLKLLEGAAGVGARAGSDIVEEFHLRLNRIELQVQSFRTSTSDSWSANARMGFFMALQEEFPRANWRYVPNPRGGFYAFFWHGGKKARDGCEPYLQIEAGADRLDLCFKISTPAGGDIGALRARWQRDVLTAGAQIAMDVRRPQRLGKGVTMTVAVLSGFPPVDGKGHVDVGKTTEAMRNAGAILNACISDAVPLTDTVSKTDDTNVLASQAQISLTPVLGASTPY